MTLVATQADTNTPMDIGSALQVISNADQLGLASTIAANDNITSNVILTNGYKLFAFGLTSTQAGSLSIQRYLDNAGKIPQGAPLTANLAANKPMIVNTPDNVAFQSLQITVNNSGTSQATLSNVLLLIQSV